MSHPTDHIPYARDLLRSDFGVHEVLTVHELMACMTGPMSNSAFRRVVMLMLRGHYSTALNYPEDLKHLACYFWRPKDDAGKEGTLTVDFSYNFDDKKPDRIPGIYVGFGGCNLKKLGMGNHHSHSEDRSTENLAKGSLLTISVHHVFKSLDDACDMAEMSQLFLLAMSKVIQNATGAEGFEVKGFAQAVKNKLSSDIRNYEVVLSVEISYTLAAALSEESHRIRVISGVIGATT